MSLIEIERSGSPKMISAKDLYNANTAKTQKNWENPWTSASACPTVSITLRGKPKPDEEGRDTHTFDAEVSRDFVRKITNPLTDEVSLQPCQMTAIFAESWMQNLTWKGTDIYHKDVTERSVVRLMMAAATAQTIAEVGSGPTGHNPLLELRPFSDFDFSDFDFETTLASRGTKIHVFCSWKHLKPDDETSSTKAEPGEAKSNTSLDLLTKGDPGDPLASPATSTREVPEDGWGPFQQSIRPEDEDPRSQQSAVGGHPA